MRRHAASLVGILFEHYGVDVELLGAEVGVWRGELSADLLHSFPKLDLIMVDLWKPFGDSAMHDKDNDDATMLKAFEDAKQNTHFARHRRLVAQQLSVVEASCWEDADLDFLFLDADHFYDSVRADLHAWWPKIHSDGIMAGHDYNGMGDRRKGWGVKRAVDEFFGPMDITVHVEPGLVWWVNKCDLKAAR